jgi:hypothetical protein
MKMKVLEKHLTTNGNLGIVQFGTLEDEGFAFLPAGPAIESGGLIIKESASEGVVNSLLAINNTPDFLLLTDMDILKGAKQNRAVNSSVLIAPGSSTGIDVSCVERLRWDYTSPTFRMSDNRMDPGMRSAKAESLRQEAEGITRGESTQSRMWSLISSRITGKGSVNPTEDYEKELQEEHVTDESFRKIGAVAGCNGMMVFADKQILALDLFGNREAYRFYFPGLRDAAFRMRGKVPSGKAIGEAEAFYRLDEYMDEMELHLKPSEVLNGTGTLRRDTRENNPGFELRYHRKPVHMASFVLNGNA